MKKLAIFLLGATLVLAFAGAAMAAPVAVNEPGQLSASVELGGIGIGYGVTDNLTIHVETPWFTGIAGDVTGKLNDSLYWQVSGIYLLYGLGYGIAGGVYTPVVEEDNLAVLVGGQVSYAAIMDPYEEDYLSGISVGGGVEAQYKVSETVMIYGDLSVSYVPGDGIGIGYNLGVNVAF